MSTKYENYDPVPDNDSEDGSPRPPESRRQRRNLADWLAHPAVPWTLTLIFFTLSLLLAMYIDQTLDPQHCQQPSHLGSFETGYATDFGMSTHPSIDRQKLTFLNSHGERTHPRLSDPIHRQPLLPLQRVHVHPQPRSRPLRGQPRLAPGDRLELG